MERNEPLNPEFICFYCAREYGDNIVYHTKARYDIGRSSIEEPALCCDNCLTRARKGLLHESPFYYQQGNKNYDGWAVITKSELITTNDNIFYKKYLIPNGVYEPNRLSGKVWRNKIWRLRKILKSKKNAVGTTTAVAGATIPSASTGGSIIGAGIQTPN